jgi:hypothetical protein
MHVYYIQVSALNAQVLFAGTSEQVSQVLESAESFREDLVERGVILVTLPIFGDATYGSNSPVKLSKDDLRLVFLLDCV